MSFSINPHRRAAFTLIELLIVIAIIAILASILFPVFGRARENARRSSCQSNLKQIGIGVMQYTQDYDDFLPPRTSMGTSAATGGSANIQNILQPYIKNYQIFQCPSNDFNTKAMNDDVSGLSRVSYIANTKDDEIFGTDNGGLFAKNTNTPGNRSAVSLAAVTFPSTTVAFGEGNTQASDFIINAPYFTSNGNCSNRPCLAAPHLSTSNFLFADGHVKAMRPTQTMTPTNMWHRDNVALTSANGYNNEEAIIRQATTYYK